MGLLTLWHERYHCHEAGGFPSTTKQKAVVERASGAGWADVRDHGSFDAPATWTQIGLVHDERYVEAIRSGQPPALARSPGLRWAPELAASVARIWSGHVAACRLALDEGLVVHPVSGAHHAKRAHGGGFCTFNFLVGAARVLLDAGRARRVLVVDLDTHQGNGTWELAGDDARIGIFDLSGSGFGVPETQTDGRFSRLAAGPDDYFRLLDALPAFVAAFRPDLVQYQAGMDCHEDDVVGGIRGMTAERLWERDRFVFETLRARGVPVVVNLAGGYQGSGTVDLHLGTLRKAHRVQ